MKKKFTYDGKSRPATELYKKELIESLVKKKKRN